MKSSDNNVKTDNERIIYRAKLHWGILLGPAIILFFGWLQSGSRGQQAIVLTVFGVIWGILSYINLRRSEIVLTDNRLLIDIGFPAKKHLVISLDEITNFDFYQPSLGSILNFGKIIFVLKDKKKKAFRFIASPGELVRQVHVQAVALRDNKKIVPGKRKK
jgi:hypothetical protein